MFAQLCAAAALQLSCVPPYRGPFASLAALAVSRQVAVLLAKAIHWQRMRTWAYDGGLEWWYWVPIEHNRKSIAALLTLKWSISRAYNECIHGQHCTALISAHRKATVAV